MRLALVVVVLALTVCGCKKRGKAAAEEARAKAAAAEQKDTVVAEQSIGSDATSPAKPTEQPRLSGCKVEHVQAVVKPKRPDAMQCYRKALSRNPAAKGRVAIEIHIDRVGHAKFLGVQTNETNDEELARCLFRILKPLRYPLPDEEPCVVVYPYVFSAD